MTLFYCKEIKSQVNSKNDKGHRETAWWPLLRERFYPDLL